MTTETRLHDRYDTGHTNEELEAEILASHNRVEKLEEALHALLTIDHLHDDDIMGDHERALVEAARKALRDDL
jgi:hypothetical protein